MPSEPNRLEICESPESAPERSSHPKPEGPNPKRPNPQIKKQAFDTAGSQSPEVRSASKRGESLAESEGNANMEEVVLKHVEASLEKALDNIASKKVGSNAAKGSGNSTETRLSDLIEQRVEASINSRLTSKDVDSMIVASVATRDIVKNVDAVASAVDRDHIDSLVKARMNEREVELEKRLLEQVQWQLQNPSAVAPAVSMSRPPTSPRPFSSDHQQRAGPQNKAAWTAGTLYTVATVPNHDTSLPLNHANLETDLTEKVLATQPDRVALGFNEIIMRDIANSVVRELVGIFESLLDRLLIEKKHDTLRTMVAELVTEDMLKLVATGHEQLKQRDFGHITMELERLGGEARERDKSWEERFAVTQELTQSQDDLYHFMSDRHAKLEERLAAVEQISSKLSEFNSIFERQKNDIEEVRQSNLTQSGKTDNVCAQLEDLKTYAKKNYLTRDMLDNSVREINTTIQDLTNNLKETAAELRGCLASNDALEEVRKAMDDRFNGLASRLSTADASIEGLDKKLAQAQNYNDETFCSQAEHSKSIEKIMADTTEKFSQVAEQLEKLEEIKATKKEVDELRDNVRSNQIDIRARVDKASSGLDTTTGSLMTLQQRVDQHFATKKYVDDTTKTMVDEATERSDAKEELGKLRKDIELTVDDLRHSKSQQYQARKELNETIEELEKVRTATVELRGRCDTLDKNFVEVDGREASHWNEGQEEWRKQKQSHDDLEYLFKAFKDEYASHKESQKAESESLRQHSTQLFLKQMDEAMKITDTINDVALENKKLNETVRAIKLPPVSA